MPAARFFELPRAAAHPAHPARPGAPVAWWADAPAPPPARPAWPMPVGGPATDTTSAPSRNDEGKSTCFWLRTAREPGKTTIWYLSTYAIPALLVAGVTARALEVADVGGARVVLAWLRPLAEVVAIFGALMTAQHWPLPDDNKLCVRQRRSAGSFVAHALAFAPCVGVAPATGGYGVAFGVCLAWLALLLSFNEQPYPSSPRARVAALSTYCGVRLA